jgi:AhpD family alkylhydroperoxidase
MAIRHVHPVKPSSAQGLVAEVYAQVKRDFGRIAEPFMLHSPLPNLLAACWMACRETELVGAVPRTLKEAVAASVSNVNHCSYCVDAHTVMLEAAGNRKAAQAIRNNQCDEISDANLKLIVQWAHATSSPKSPALLSPPFTRQEAPEIIGTAVYYHYMNRMATVLLGDSPLPSNNWLLKGAMERAASRMFQEAIKAPKKQGASLQFLPKAPLPSDLQWAKPSPEISWAFSAFAKAVEEVGDQSLPLEVRVFVQEQLNEWTGKCSELSLAWCEEEIGKLDADNQAAARLALFTALAPSKVDDRVISEFQQRFPSENQLLGALAWASFAAARKTGTWLRVPPA